MRVYCKCEKLITIMTVINWEIDEDLDSISYTYMCPKCNNTIQIYLNSIKNIIENGVEKL